VCGAVCLRVVLVRSDTNLRQLPDNAVVLIV